MESELLVQASVFFTFVREQSLDTYNKFIALMEKHVPHAETGSIELMFKELQTLFGSDHYLINKFAPFVEHYRNIKISSEEQVQVAKKETPLFKNHQLIKNGVDLLNNVSRTLKDQDQLQRFIDVVAGFGGKHNDVTTVRKKACKVLKRHPLLIREWSGFLAEADLGNGSKAKNYQELMFDFEHAMHKMDLLFQRAVSVKDSAKRLISENTDKDPMERIDVGVYFCAINVRYVKKELKGCRHVLVNKSKLRGKAVRVTKKILSCAEKKIKKLTRSWSPEKKKMALKRHEEDNQILVFDWHNDDAQV